MASSLFNLFQGSSRGRSQQQLDELRREYRYRAPADNLLSPIAMLEKPPRREEQSLRWIAEFMPRYLAIAAQGKFFELSEEVQRRAFRFEKMEAFGALLGSQLPHYAAHARSDESFAYRRVAGACAIVIRQETDLARLRRKKIPIDTARIESWLEANRPKHWTGSTDLAAAAKEGHLYVVDYELIQHALSSGEPRDSRWRGRYAAAPVAVLLEAPGFYAATDLVPLAIQIDQRQPKGAYNPVYTPEDGWGWEIAKLYVEAADSQYHLGCSHGFRCHLMMEPFAIATPRQLPEGHPIYTLLEPHLALTIATNDSVYQNFTDRKQLYYQWYSGDLEEIRGMAIRSYEAIGFRGLQLEAELAGRGVSEGPAEYPYRDDAVLWLQPIERFVRSYVGSYYASDRAVVDDTRLQAWVEELMDPNRGALRDLVEDGRMDTRDKLVALLAQVLFLAGPEHASKHFGGNFFYRYAPAMPSACFMPPPESPEAATRARYLRTLPTIEVARSQWVSSHQGSFRYGRFGHYDGYALGDTEEVALAIEQLREDLDQVRDTLESRVRERPWLYNFFMPDLVPNSINL